MTPFVIYYVFFVLIFVFNFSRSVKDERTIENELDRTGVTVMV